MSSRLEKARMYEAEQEKEIAKGERPAFHLSSRVGWMNDPNGFSKYQGEYHMFYQYHPYTTVWGPMHWGHAVSKDLLRWEYLPAALAPDTEADEKGCFSGSAIKLEDGRQLLMYTGVSEQKEKDGTTWDAQMQCMAVGDGRNYEKYAHNPVLTGKDLPEGFSVRDFRDPKLWQEADGSYRCVVACRAEDQSGAILLFESRDGFHWSFVSVLDRSRNEYGRMWECPDFFLLDGKAVLIVNPQEMMAKGEFHNGNNTMCIIGHIDELTNTLVRESVQALDFGIDFYATQTFCDSDGRRIMGAWMQNWDTGAYRMPDCKWYGQMILPRELHIENGRIVQKPVAELETLHGERVCYSNLDMSGVQKLDGISGRYLDMTIVLKEYTKGSVLRINLAQNAEHCTAFEVDTGRGILRTDRTHSGSRVDVLHERSCRLLAEPGKEIRLRVIMDLYSIEVFVNDGAQTMTTCIYTPAAADGISFETTGHIVADMEKYELNI